MWSVCVFITNVSWSALAYANVKASANAHRERERRARADWRRRGAARSFTSVGKSPTMEALDLSERVFVWAQTMRWMSPVTLSQLSRCSPCQLIQTRFCTGGGKSPKTPRISRLTHFAQGDTEENCINDYLTYYRETDLFFCACACRDQVDTIYGDRWSANH